MERAYRPYIDPDFESFIERIHPPRVTIDNDTHKNRTLVKVDSANKHGILLEMVQVLTDLDLVISKSYISSDGDWFMDVFHVTDRHGNKITDESLILYIQQAICASRRGVSKETHSRLKRVVRPRHVSNEHTALEISVVNRPGLLSEVAAVITELECIVTAALAWTHGSRAVCIIHIEDGSMGRPITDSKRLAKIHEQLEHVVEAHHYVGEKRSVRLTAPAAGRTHTEQRLHQLMYADGDYGTSSGCSDNSAAHVSHCTKIHVSIESCREKGYSIVSTMSRDRPKLLFDTICALTDLQFVVFHAAVCSKGEIAYQEYFIRRTDGRTLDTQSQRQKLTQCLIAAIERRVSHGLRLDVCTENRTGLLSNLTRKFRESGVSISRAEIGTDGDKAIGSFYVTDPLGNDVDPKIIDSIQKEIGGSVIAVNRTPLWTPKSSKDPLKTSSIRAPTSNTDEDKSWFSLGGLFRSQLDRLSSNFGFIRS